jgi:RNA polymerase sigma factor (sigma-70 family)
MARQSLNGVLQHIRKVAAVPACRGLSERELLERFVDTHDEAAFTVLIERHGPMVLGVCRRALPNVHDAEDACQATFLVLARKADSVRKKTSLSSWLHGVACRVAADLKRSHARRKSRERGVDALAPKDPAAEVSWREIQAILDAELQRLPERHRAPLILCYLECLTRDEAAQRLGLSPGSLHGRLERGRDLLREQLTKRGLTLTAVMSAAVLGGSVAQAALAPTFVVSSTKAAMLLAAGQSLAESAVATHVVALTREVLKNMLLTKLKLGAGAVLCAGLFVAIIGGSFTSPSIAQDAKPKPVFVDPSASPAQPLAKAESDADFIRRISKDLRGANPTPAEVHFFVASKDAGRRQKLIDLFIEERQAKKAATPMLGGMGGGMMGIQGMGGFQGMGGGMMGIQGMGGFQGMGGGMMGIQGMGGLQGMGGGILGIPGMGGTPMMGGKGSGGMGMSGSLLNQPTTGLGKLQKEFYKELHAAKDKGDVAKITQTYLDRLIDFVKANPKNQDVPDAIRQIVLVYESQGKTVEASAWRDKLMKEHPKTSIGSGSGNPGS